MHFQVDAIDLEANDWFEWTRFHAAKVRNVSKVGSQIGKPQTGFELVATGAAALGYG
jgi:hypothetical protein